MRLGDEPDYVARVRAVHSHGGYGSLGYNYDWAETEARKNLLRTHTTAVSARQLYALAQQKEVLCAPYYDDYDATLQFTPVKYFSIDRVFRNETLDATHLAEFHQVEGVIADRGLTLGHLIGVLHEFFARLGWCLTEL
jgi:phenylalanyl-tRNA synthetase alpha chain